MNWINADLHLGEDRFDLMGRPGFKNAQHMVDVFVDYHNELVSPDDTVYMNGDVINQKTPEFLPQIERFNGRKILLRGNHDRVFSDEDLSPYFEKIYAEGEGLYMEIKGIWCKIQHYPTESEEGCFNLVGHIHSAWKYQINAFNVGVDCNHYRPYKLEESVEFAFNAINKFYDEDVWISQHKSQIPWYSKRGKQGRYLDIKGPVGG